MGKSNRIRVNKAGVQAKTLSHTRRQKKGMPSWAINVIAIAVAAVILLSVAFIFITSNGIHTRMMTAMKSDHFTVNQNMMSYYFNAKYQNFYANYQTYITGKNFSLDVNKDLKSQTFGDTSGGSSAMELYFGLVDSEFEGTWYDYFMSETEKEVKTMLYYCEEAKARGWELGDEEMKSIDATISSLSATATQNNRTLDSFIAYYFGSGVNEQDVRDALKLSELASLSMTKLSEWKMGEISDDRVHEAYELHGGNDVNGKNVNRVDYSYYTFEVKYTEVESDVKAKNADATEEEILAAYEEAIAEARANAEALEKITDADAFEDFILPFLVEKNVDEEYANAEKPDEGVPTREDREKIREAMIAEIVADIRDEVEEPAEAAVKAEDGTYTVYGVTVTEEMAKVYNAIKLDAADFASLALPNYRKDNTPYADSDAFSTWAFDAERAAGDVYTDFTGDGSDEEEEITNTDGYFYAGAYLLRTPAYPDTTPTRNVAYMIFSNESDAAKAIVALQDMDGVDLEAFHEVAHAQSPDAHDELENYMKGDMDSTAFDNWVYGTDTQVGSFTSEPVKLDESTYAVLYYVSEGEETWFMEVKNVLFNADFEEYFAGMEDAYAIKTDNGAMNAIVPIAGSKLAGMSSPAAA